MNDEWERWRDASVRGIGPRALWDGRSGWTGVLCSRRVPASLILAAQDWANCRCMACHAPNVAPTTPNEIPDAPGGDRQLGMASHAPTVGGRSAGDAPTVFVSGWHSPVEQEIERILARGKVPLVLAAARSPEKMRVAPSWRERIGENRGLIVSPFESGHRLTSRSAEARNRWILGVCPRVVVPHAAPGGALHALLMETLAAPGAPQISVFAHADHAELLSGGARQM